MLKEVSKRYDKIAKRYSEKIYSHFWNRILEYPPTVAEIKKLNLKGKKVLDVGCGSGRYSKIIFSRGAKVWGLDLSRNMVEIAKNYVKNVKFSVGNIEKTKFKDRFFDVVFSGLVLEYLDRNNFFKEMSRILRKNGILLFSAHVPYNELGYRIIKGKQIFKFHNYFNEGKFYQHWPNFKTRMCFKHATMETTIHSILKNGFIIEDYIDIKPPSWSRKKFTKDYERVIRLPPFFIMKLRKVK